MSVLKNCTFLFILLTAVLNAIASDNKYFVDHLALNPNNLASLQRGAQLYFNYCSGCHSLKHERYNHIAHLIGVENSQHQVYADLIQTSMMFDPQGDIRQTIRTALLPQDAQKWFGITPPDLSNETRTRSPAWIYNYLRGFYRDASRTTGANNLILPNTAMPNVLLPLRGETIPVFTHQSFDHFITLRAGQLSPLDFDHAMYDLVNFLGLVADPNHLLHTWIELGILAFLSILFMMVYFWYRTFHKDSSCKKCNR